MKKGSKKEVKEAILPSETAQVGNGEVEVKVIDEIIASMTAKPTDQRIWVKMRDTGSCWGVANYHLANRQIKLLPNDNIVKEGIKLKAIVALTDIEVKAHLLTLEKK